MVRKHCFPQGIEAGDAVEFGFSVVVLVPEAIKLEWLDREVDQEWRDVEHWRECCHF